MPSRVPFNHLDCTMLVNCKRQRGKGAKGHQRLAEYMKLDDHARVSENEDRRDIILPWRLAWPTSGSGEPIFQYNSKLPYLFCGISNERESESALE